MVWSDTNIKEMILDLLIVLIFSSVSEEINAEFPPIVEVKYEQGTIVGFREEAGNNLRPFYSFKGIPYALPPVEELRLKPPVGDVKWTGRRDGSWDPPVCPQFRDSEFVGEEDCLYLNVYTPKPDNAGYPVMVFIHAGDFINGGVTEYSPLPLLTRDIVLVAMQYRLGILGFLSAEDDGLPGNLGLRDQTMALLWVQNYIKNFGGDPHTVTIFGNGGGAASVHYQILTPYAKGLFSRAIMQSGSSLCPTMLRKHHSFVAMELLSKFNCRSSDTAVPSYPHSSLILDCLKDVPVKELASSYRDYFEWQMLPLLPVPRIDGDYLPDHPVVLLNKGKYNKVDIIAGFNQHDGTIISANLYHYPYLMKLFKDKFLSVGALLMAFDEEEKPAQLAGITYHKLVGAKNINDRDGAEALTKLFTDRLFAVPLHDTLTLHTETSPENKLYYYKMVHRGKFSICSFFNMPHSDKWVCVSDDLPYLFNDGRGFSPLTHPDDLHLQDLIVTLWTNFATYGTPTPDESLGFHWTTYTKVSHLHLELDPSPKMTLVNDTKTLQFWHSLDIAMNKYLFPNGTSHKILDDEGQEEEEIDYDSQYPVYSTNLEDKSISAEAYQRSIVVPNRNLNKPIDPTNQENILLRGDSSFDFMIEDLIASSGMWSDAIYPASNNRKKDLLEPVDVRDEISEQPLQGSPLPSDSYRSDKAEDLLFDRGVEDYSDDEESEDIACIKKPVDHDNEKDFEHSEDPVDKKHVKKPGDGISETDLGVQGDEDDSELRTDEDNSELPTDEENSELRTNEENSELRTDEEDSELRTDEEDSELQTYEDSELQTEEEDLELRTDEKDSKLETDEEDPKLWTEEKKPEDSNCEEEELWTSDKKCWDDACNRKPLEQPVHMNPLGRGIEECVGDECTVEPETHNSNQMPHHTGNKEPDDDPDNKAKHTSDKSLDPTDVKDAEEANVIFRTLNNNDIFEKDEVDLYTMISAGLMKAKVLLKGAGEGNTENTLSFIDKDNLDEVIATYGDYVLQYLKDIKVSHEQILQMRSEQKQDPVEQRTVSVLEEEEIESLLATPEVTPDKLYPNKKLINYGKVNFNVEHKREMEFPILVSSEGEGKL